MADGGVTIDANTFGKRLKLVYDQWRENAAAWGNVTSFAVPSGAASDQLRYLKSLALQLWLFGYELPDTLMLFLDKELHVVTSGKKATLVGKLEDACQAAAGVKLVVHTKPKSEDGVAQMQAALQAAKGAGPTLGALPKEKPEGAFAATWQQQADASGLQIVDVSSAMADLFSVKDEEELKNVKKAAFLCAQAMVKFAVPKIEEVIDSERKMKHTRLSEKTEEAITAPNKILGVKLREDNVDIAYPPIFQSGGDYDLKVSAQSNDNNLHYGVIVASLGARYSMYCANVARTLLVDPSDTQEQEYNALLAAQQAAISALVEGAALHKPYDAAVAKLQELGKGELAEKLGRNIGFGMGLEFREGNAVLNNKNSNTAKAGMVFNVSLGVSDLERVDASDAQSRKYALLLADTVVVQGGGKEPEVATAGAPKSWKAASYYLDDEQENDVDSVPAKAHQANGSTADAYRDKRTALRGANDDFKFQEQQRRQQKQNQEELLMRINEETRRALVEGAGGKEQAALGGRKVSDIVVYKDPADMPQGPSLQIMVDQRHESVLVPIYGHLVPFHVLTIKTAANNQDGDKAYIRINFNIGAGFEPSTRFPNALYLKELSFRTLDLKHAQKVVQEIKSLRAAVMSREKERAERASLVQQEKLVRNKGRTFSLSDLWIRPSLATGKGRKLTGTLEAHSNGFRYSLPDGSSLDIMYRNIKHALFQPAENDLMTLIHFHLINPIMVGKKKTQDVQLYTEVMDVNETLDARRNHYDPDELEDEQRDRERRNKINRMFQQFVRKVQHDIWERDFADLNLEFEIPFRELAFNGIPSKVRSMVTVYPTVNCLIELTEAPFTVVTMSDVQLVSLERVGFNLRQFDMVLVFKDLQREVFTINAIDSKSLDTIKEWLTTTDIKFYENKLNLAWKNILKSILEDPEGFLDNGGWSFLDQEKSDTEEEEESDEGDDEFQAGASDVEEVSEEGSSDDESLVESEEGDGSEYSDDGSEDSGKDWDELEEEARAADQEKEYTDDSGDERTAKKRKAASGPARPQPVKRKR